MEIKKTTKKSVFLALAVVLLISILAVIETINKKNESANISNMTTVYQNFDNEYNINNTSSTNDDVKNNKISEITIYDIEEGYLTVPYNEEATKHNYIWENLIDNNNLYKYEDKNYYTKLGIDVSSYQGNIDWKAVKEDGIEFAILRLGYRGYGEKGTLVLDEKFKANYEEATRVGIQVGIYFFSQAITKEEVLEEVNFVINNLEGTKISYPIYYDLEKIKNDTARTDNLTKEEINEFSHIFCNEIQNRGFNSGIYGNAKTFTTRIELEEFNDITKWYADYQEKPLYPYAFDIWQYTEKGNVNGIGTKVDINLQFIKK